MKSQKEISITLWELFINFFLIGSYAFGGNMALLAIVEKVLVEKKKVLNEQQILDGISLASILPGPLAVNTVVFYGYIISGIKGALVSFLGILLPTFLLVTGFSIYYFSFSSNIDLDVHILFVMPVIVAVITSVGYKLAKKQLHLFSQWTLALTAFVVAVVAPNVFFLLITIIFGGLIGYFLYNKPIIKKSQIETIGYSKSKFEIEYLLLVISIVIGIILILALITNKLNESLSLTSVFSGMSLTLFGGGYVIIPIMEQALVSDLSWVTTTEFNAAIGISQITPGPIMSSVTFIGYKMAGITGAIVSTIGIFVPSALLMIALSSFQQKIKHLNYIEAVLTGMRAVVVGLIFNGAYIIGVNNFDYSIIPWVIFIASFVLLTFTKVHPALVIISALIFSLI